jgi:dihydrolipoamide dehydrogenase
MRARTHMSTSTFDVVVIGAGPGGYIAAIRAAQLGLKVACVDDWQNDKGGPAPGGTCTNVGCIPSKALLQSSEHFEHAGQHFADHGIGLSKLSIDVAQMLARKNTVVQQNNDGILFLFKKNKVTFFHGRGSLLKAEASGCEVLVKGKGKSEGTDTTLSAKNVVIATGSSPRVMPNVAFDEDRILSNDGALRLAAVPKTLGVIGAGVIGLEMGSVWRRLGAQVTVLEAATTFLGAVDQQIAKEAHKAFTKQGLGIQLGVKIAEVKASKTGVKVDYVDAQGSAQTLACERLIVSIGRIPNTQGLNAEAAGLKLDERGLIAVNDDCQTNLPHVWAVGDVVRGPMLAHKAEEEGVAVAERIAGQHGHVDFNLIPWVIYTSPEIAWVGQTFPFMANGRARALGDTTGLVKFLADAQTDEILGVHIVGPQASELISEAVVAMSFKASSEDIARICHAHPSLSEAVKEAALAVEGRALNF